MPSRLHSIFWPMVFSDRFPEIQDAHVFLLILLLNWKTKSFGTLIDKYQLNIEKHSSFSVFDSFFI